MSSLVYSKVVFPLIFLARGLDVKSKIKEISALDRDHFHGLYQLQSEKFKKVIEAANLKSAFYRQIITSNPEISSSGLDALSLFPMLTKEAMRKWGAEIVSDSSKAISRTTAGTTGTPVTVYIDNGTVSWQLATRYYFFGVHGIKIGDREARFWGRPTTGIRYKLKDLLLNRRRFTFCGSESELRKELELLVHYQPDYFYGYSSLILNAAIVCAENSVKIDTLKAIICTAEVLTPQQRNYIMSVFGCPVITEYGCTEADIIAFECEHGKLHVMSHNVYVERPVGSGALVMTDLNNCAMPIIRYELGDDVDIDFEAHCECGRHLPVVTKLKGRTIDQVLKLFDGSTMHAVQFAYLIEEIAGKGHDLLRFKIVYTSELLVFYIHLNGDSRNFEKELSQGIEKITQGKLPYEIKFEAITMSPNKKFSYFEIK